MNIIHLKVITPKKIVREEDVVSVTAPSAAGEITILPRHQRIFSLLKEGIITIRTEKEEDYLAVGGGYIETDGKILNILVSRAYGQHDIDEAATQKAIQDAEQLIRESTDENARKEAGAVLRRSLINMKLIRRKRKA